MLLSRIFDIIAPESAPQTYVPPLGGVAHPLAGEVLAAMRQHGKNPVGLWRVVNGLANARNPDSRARRRCWRLRYLCAFRELLRAGALVRHGPLIALQDFATRPRPRLPSCLSASVVASTSKNGGSSPVVPMFGTAIKDSQVIERELVSGDPNLVGCAPDTKSATPAAAEISAAASALAQRPRKRKKWSGWLNGERMWRLREVIVPGGQVLAAFFVRRNWVYALLPDTPEYEGQVFRRYRADDVRVYRSPHAALLGRQPPRAGRRRGRPSRHQAPYLSVSPQADPSGLQERRELWRLRPVA
jgi:hypothetical protein